MQSPACQSPACQSPACQSPAWQSPTCQSPTCQSPACQSPAWQNPGWQNPGWQSPTSKNPTRTPVPPTEAGAAPANQPAGWLTSRARRLRLLLIGLFILLVATRMPLILTAGRFWAEEGVVYFSLAWHDPWPAALFAIHTGYLNIAASGAALLALHLAPLEQAPRVTALIALLIQTLPAVILATSRIPWLRSWPAFGAALLLLLIPLGDAEVWINAITSQFHLALCVALILASDISGGPVGILRAAVLVLAPLAGPLSGSLAPLFFLRAISDRSWMRLAQTVLLAAPTLVQGVIVLTHPEPGRAGGLGVELLLAVIGLQHVILPITGMRWAPQLAAAATGAFRQGDISLAAIIMVAAAVLGIGGLGVALWRWGDIAARWVFTAAMVLAVTAYAAALTLGDPLNLLLWLGSRYTFAPSVLFSLSLLGLAATGPLRRRLIPAALLLWMVQVGIQPYFAVPAFYAHGLDWRAEVAAWRLDPSHQLRLWPLGFTPALQLDPAARPGK